MGREASLISSRKILRPSSIRLLSKFERTSPPQRQVLEDHADSTLLRLAQVPPGGGDELSVDQDVPRVRDDETGDQMQHREEVVLHV